MVMRTKFGYYEVKKYLKYQITKWFQLGDDQHQQHRHGEFLIDISKITKNGRENRNGVANKQKLKHTEGIHLSNDVMTKTVRVNIVRGMVILGFLKKIIEGYDVRKETKGAYFNIFLEI